VRRCKAAYYIGDPSIDFFGLITQFGRRSRTGNKEDRFAAEILQDTKIIYPGASLPILSILYILFFFILQRHDGMVLER